MNQTQEAIQDPVESVTQAVALPEPHREPNVADDFPFEFQEPLPALEDRSFQEFIFGSPEREVPGFDVTDDECVPIGPEQDYASFGDEGTTATVNTYGSIVQITRYLGAGRSGFFSLDMEDVDEPYLVQSRADQLMKRCANYDGIFFAPDIDTSPELDDCYKQPWQAKYDLSADRYAAANRRVRAIPGSSTRFARNWTKLRELEFLDSGYQFNEKDDWDDYLGPNGYSFILVKKGIVLDSRVTPEEAFPDVVGLICAISINGKIRELERGFDDGPCYRVKLTAEEDGFWAGPNEPLDITTAFRLQLMPQRCDWRQFLVSDADFLRPWSALRASSFQMLTFSNEPRLDHSMRRNLEHILSVCSVPVGVAAGLARTDEETEPVALTCGDMSGHRLVTSASFFAFEFLLSMHEHIKKQHDDACRCNEKHSTVCFMEFHKFLCRRIEQTCQGHLTWIKQAKLDEAGCFETHYWASGEKIETFQPDTEVLSMRSVTDTPFQIIKVADSTSRLGKYNELLQRCLQRFIRPWIKNLDVVNRRGFYVFPRPPRLSHVDEYQNYRLEDHFWIWRALLGLETLGFANELSKQSRRRQKKPNEEKDKTREELDQSETYRLDWDYFPTDFQQRVVRSFTAQNIVSQKRMLAVARSSSQYSLWKATIDAQVFHEENQDSSWDSPLRYGLALMMATKGFQINSKPCDYMSKVAKDCLFQSSSGSGLFPGQIDIGTKESEIYDHERSRDFYWHVTFEVPYILWENSQREKEIEEINELYHQNGSSVPRATRLAVNLKSQEQIAGGHNLEMRRSMPSNVFYERQSIVEISDEWLYPYPDFFDFQPSTEISPTLIEELKTEIDPASFLQDAEASFRPEHCFWEECPPICVVSDIPRTHHDRVRKYAKALETRPEGLCIHYLYEKLATTRTATDAKKRLIWLPMVDRDTALLCIFLSPKSETANLASFFDRYERREKFFFDETAATSNSWITELHLSSYRLVLDEHGNKSPSNADLKFLGAGMKIRRSGMSFRFVGDFFDRHWTCHILGHGPQDDQVARQSGTRIGKEEHIEVRFQKLINSGEFYDKIQRDKKPWGQRKVLELLLFDAVLQRIISGYDELLQEIDSHLRRMLSLGQSTDAASSGASSISSQMDSYAYLTVRKEWPTLQYTLQIMEGDLQETLFKVELWRSREGDRAPESPRWTRSDESKYRSVINKLKTSNARRIRDVERRLSKIQYRLTSIRDDLNFQSTENVRFFTYVTVVFIPLGFAAAIFSMNGAPPTTPLIGMIVTAVVALILTVIALANAQTLDETIFKPGYRALGKFKTKSGRARNRQKNRIPGDAQGVPPRDGPQRDQEFSPVGISPAAETPSAAKWFLRLKSLPNRYREFRQRRNKHGGESDDRGLEAGTANGK